jgi:hypothetical protein
MPDLAKSDDAEVQQENVAILFSADADSAIVANQDLTTRSVSWVFGFGAYSTFAWLYDYPLYGFVIWQLGPIFGGVAMTLLTIPVDLYSLRLYDWSQRDWLAIEYLKSHERYQGRNPLRKFCRYVLVETPTSVKVIALSVKFNAFITTALLRKGAFEFNGLTRRDWGIFWLSFVATQVYWIVVVALGVEGLKGIVDLL